MEQSSMVNIFWNTAAVCSLLLMAGARGLVQFCFIKEARARRISVRGKIWASKCDSHQIQTILLLILHMFMGIFTWPNRVGMTVEDAVHVLSFDVREYRGIIGRIVSLFGDSD